MKVTLKDIKPSIWRRLLLPSDTTFWELHIAIQDSFGWEDYHLHQFFVGDAWDKDTLRINTSTPEDDLFEDEKEPLNESKTILSDIFNRDIFKVNYVYDYGDNWEHEIVLEKILPYTSAFFCPQSGL